MRESTKVFTGGGKTTIVGGNITIKTGGNHHIWAESISITSGKQIIQTAKEGIIYGDYVPPEKYYTTHPSVEKVEFFDQNNKLLNQNTKDFYFGQKLKIKVTTKNSKDGAMIYLTLQGKSKSKNQKFDMMNGSGYRWGFVPVFNNQYETPLFELNPNWYSDDLEEYDYDQHITKIKEEDLNEFYVKISFEAKPVYLPLEGQRLKPIAYKRNYEELIGLFNTDNSGSKDMLTNYENKFIDAYKEKNDAIKDIVDGFSEYLCEDNRDLTTDQIEAKVIKSGKELWNYAVWQHKDHTSTIVTTIKKTGEKIEEVKDIEAIADDRPLYWARIVMQVILKRQYVYVEDIKTLPQKDQDDFFIKSIVPKTSKLYKAIQLFEENSRNYTGIDFSKAGGKKKVLITGFDPFQLNPDTNFNTSMGSNSANTFNPSGILALFLQNNQDLQNKNIQIQTCVFPVRYEDFDNKVVENVIQRHIGQVDLIITTSLNGGNNWFDIEADAIEYRGGFHDNMCIGGQDYKEYNYNSSRFVLNTNKKHNLTTLPKNKIFGSNLSVNINGLDVKFDSSKLNSSTEGGGGNYLSNEIMYRTTAIRGVSSNKPVGHFHLANLDNISRIKEVVDVAVEVIKKIIL